MRTLRDGPTFSQVPELAGAGVRGVRSRSPRVMRPARRRSRDLADIVLVTCPVPSEFADWAQPAPEEIRIVIARYRLVDPFE